MTDKPTCSPLYERAMAYDYGDQERSDLMKKVWSGTPFMTECFTGNVANGDALEIMDWCRERWGDEAHPIHGMPGRWQRGSATVYGWTWFGFETAEMLQEFEAAWQCGEHPDMKEKE